MMTRLMVFLILGLLTFPVVAQADGNGRGFLFPGLAAIRANRQARAFQAQANLNIAKANAQAAVVFRNQVHHGGNVQFVLKNQRHFVPRNIVIAAAAPQYVQAPQYVAQSPQYVLQSPQYIVQAPQCSLPSPCAAAPAFAQAQVGYSAVSSFSVRSAGSGGCYAGF